MYKSVWWDDINNSWNINLQLRNNIIYVYLLHPLSPRHCQFRAHFPTFIRFLPSFHLSIIFLRYFVHDTASNHYFPAHKKEILLLFSAFSLCLCEGHESRVHIMIELKESIHKLKIMLIHLTDEANYITIIALYQQICSCKMKLRLPLEISFNCRMSNKNKRNGQWKIEMQKLKWETTSQRLFVAGNLSGGWASEMESNLYTLDEMDCIIP